MSEGEPTPRPRLLIFIVAYNAEVTIQKVLQRIPSTLARYDTEILIIDDGSRDQTFERAQDTANSHALPFRLTVLVNPKNQGYGGNQKIGFHYAIEKGFDWVALIHGDGQYAPECLPDLLEPLASGSADAVLGSRMMVAGAARRGGMPLYKWLGNKILTSYQNFMLRSRLSEFHSGYRLYGTAALRRIPFGLNSNDFHFDTEILIQLLRSGARIRELPIPTFYGDEICHVNGLAYAGNVFRATLVARAHEYGVLYDRKFDVREEGDPHRPKVDFPSSHSFAIDAVPPNCRALDLGFSNRFVPEALRAKGCHVTAVGRRREGAAAVDAFIEHDLDGPSLPVDFSGFDYVLLLDVIEHLHRPEAFVEQMRLAARRSPGTQVIVSSPNVAFFITRAMLLFGQFNYSKRGILDLTHTRLFTFRSLRALFESCNFETVEVRGIPAPFPLAFGATPFARALLRLNELAVRVARSLFAYQAFFVFRPRPSLEGLLDRAEIESHERSERTKAASASAAGPSSCLHA